jgi:hypothetical protein
MNGRSDRQIAEFFTNSEVVLEIEDKIEEHCRQFGINALDALKIFPILSRRYWLHRFLAHVDLFKNTLTVPGDIAEIGVFRGLGLLTWANLLEIFCGGDRIKTVYGFDNWTGFNKLSSHDGAEDITIGKTLGGLSPDKLFEELLSAINIFDSDRFIPWKPRIQLIKGNIEETTEDFVKKNPGVRFSLIHLDCDMYEPTKAALDNLWPLLSKGGLVLFDEYADSKWPGETKAADEFFSDKPNVRIKKLDWTRCPGGYVVKE